MNTAKPTFDPVFELLFRREDREDPSQDYAHDTLAHHLLGIENVDNR